VEKPAKPNAVAVIARAIILRDISNPLMLTVFIAFFWWLATNPLIVCLPPPVKGSTGKIPDAAFGLFWIS
jgi:hypothetical protein